MSSSIPAYPDPFHEEMCGLGATIAQKMRPHFPADPAAEQQRQVLALFEEIGEFVAAWRRWSGQARRCGPWADVEAELADVVITAYVTGHVFGITPEPLPAGLDVAGVPGREYAVRYLARAGGTVMDAYDSMHHFPDDFPEALTGVLWGALHAAHELGIDVPAAVRAKAAVVLTRGWRDSGSVQDSGPKTQTGEATPQDEIERLQAELEAFRAPGDWHNADHRARMLESHTEVIAEMVAAGRPAADIARQLFLYCDVAMSAVEREQARTAELAGVVHQGAQVINEQAMQARSERDELRQQLEAEATYQALLRDERDGLADRVRELEATVADRGKALADYQHACGQLQQAVQRATNQRDRARLAVDRADRLANTAGDAETTISPQELADAIGDIAQLCPGCWRIHNLWCHPHGGPMADPDPTAYQRAAKGDTP